MRFFKRFLYISVVLFIVCTITVVLCYLYVQKQGKQLAIENINDLPQSYTIIVPGALVHFNGKPSGILADRLDMAIHIFKSGKAKRVLLTGDHGTEAYDEVNHMKEYLNEKGIPDSVIFLDHAGFDTHSSMVRAIKVFEVKNAIIVNQEMYIARSLYLANRVGLNAVGITCDYRNYGGRRSRKAREIVACTKAVLEILIHKSPKYLGPKIPITGDSKWSYDK